MNLSPEQRAAIEERIASLDPRPWTHYVAYQLDMIGFSYAKMSPGDGTAYEFVFVRPATVEQWDRFTRNQHHPDFAGGRCEFNDQHRYYVANQFGPLYGWSGQFVHPDYAWDHYVDRSRGPAAYTAHVVAMFMSKVGEAITKREKEKQPNEPR